VRAVVPDGEVPDGDFEQILDGPGFGPLREAAMFEVDRLDDTIV